MTIWNLLCEMRGHCGTPKTSTAIINNSWYFSVEYISTNKDKNIYDAIFRFINDTCMELILYGKQEVPYFEQIAEKYKIKIERWKAYD